MSANIFREFIEKYGPPAGENGPVLLVREVFGATPDPWQENVLRAFGRGTRRISVRSCHGPGKTALGAWLVWVMLLTRFPQKSVATAPTAAQIYDALFAETLTWYKRLPDKLQSLFETKSDRIELRAAPEESFFSARTSRAEKPEALQGVHSEHVLLIVDEASGVPEPIFEAAVGSMSGHNATTVLLSNPVRTSGLFFDTHHSLRDMWFTMHVGHTDSTRVSDDFVNDVARRYGRDSNAFRIRCLGEFPTSDHDVVIPFELVESATDRDVVVPPMLTEVWGLDVARFGGDQNALVRRTRLSVHPEILQWSGLDLMQTTGKVKAKWDETEPEKRPITILVDSIGLGAGVVDRLRELGLPVRGVNVSEQAAFKEKYRNLRTELWFAVREWLEQRNVVLPKNDDLLSELVLPRYTFTSAGRLLVEPKSEIKKRAHKSPNVADALMLTFAGDASIMAHGGRSVSWNQPLKRGLKYIV